MRKTFVLSVVVLALCGWWIPAFAADSVAPATGSFEWSKLLSLAIPLLVPLLIFGLKSVWDRIPKAMLPILGPVIGALADVLLNMAGASTFGPQWGAVLGAAGVGLREIYDQLSGNATKVPG